MSKDGSLDQLVDVVPSGVDGEGNEVSYKVWEATDCEKWDDKPEFWNLYNRDSVREEQVERYRAWFEEKTQDGRRTLTLDPAVSSFTKMNQPTWSSTSPVSTVEGATRSMETQFRRKK
jgi:hypothetical protein